MKTPAAQGKILFIIPAYNEADNIDRLFSNIEKKMGAMNAPYRIFLVNDGSTDRTEEKALRHAARMPIEVISHPCNKGVGEVFRSGFEAALSQARPQDIIVTKEADNTSCLEILPEMVRKVRDDEADLVLASCYAKGGGIIGTTPDRVLMSSAANLLLKTFFPIPHVHTYSSFYRAYRADTLRRAWRAHEGRLFYDNGFTCVVEILIHLARLPVRIAEVPMVLRCNFRSGKSKMKKTRTIMGYFSLIRREMRLRRCLDLAVLKERFLEETAPGGKRK